MIRGYLFGDSATVAKLDRLKGGARSKVKQTIVRLTLALLVKVKQAKLSGQVLKVRTGRLRRSINQRIDEAGTKVSGIVGTPVEYARIHEYGFHGQMPVKAHLRQIKEAWGKPLKNGPRQVLVRAHSRTVDMPERSFLRSALDEMEPKIKGEIETALQTVFRGNLS